MELPLYPAPLHSFAFSEGWEIKVGKDKLAPRMRECEQHRKRFRPFRTITVGDAISDLPKITNEDTDVDRKKKYKYV